MAAPPPKPSGSYSFPLTRIVKGEIQRPAPAKPPPLPAHLPRNQRTLTGVAPPPKGTPRPPVDLGTLEPMPAPELDSTPPVPMVPLPFDDAERPTFNRAVKSAGGKLEPAEITPMPETKREKAPNSIMAAADKMPLWRAIALMTAACTGVGGVITACSRGAVEVIGAWKPVANVELAARVAEVEKLQARIESLEKTRADGLETKARTEAVEELRESLKQLKVRLRKTEGEPRVQTVQGLPRE